MIVTMGSTPTPQAVELLQRAEAFAVDGARLVEMLAGCTVVEVREQAGRRPVLAFAYELQGEDLRITVAAAAPGQPRALLGFVVGFCREAAAQLGAARLRCSTTRAALMRALGGFGVRVEAQRPDAFDLVMEC